MAEFTASPITDSNVDPNLANAYNSVQRNSLLNIGLQQDQTDRQTFRDAAPGLIARDPTATGQAMGANPAAAQAFLSSIPAMDQNTREQASNDIAASGSLADAVLAQPQDQRQAAWAAGRQSLIASGHKMVPPETYPGDSAMQTMAGLALTAQQQFELTAARPTTGNQPLLASTPGGGSLGPGGVPNAQPGGGQQGAAQPPGAAPAGFQGQLAQAESSGDPSAVNSAGYAGLYQFGTGRLQELGMYQPAPGESTKTNAWQGQLNIPGFPNVKTLADFRASPAAQNAAYQAHIGNIDQTIAATPGAQNFDPNGLRAVAHLGGSNAMQQFIASGGQLNRADSNGTSLAAYYKRFSGSGGAPAQASYRVAQGTATPTANDASPGPAAPASPSGGQPNALNLPGVPAAPHIARPAGGGYAPLSAAPAAGGNTVSLDAPEQAASLAAGTPYKLPDGTAGFAGVTTPQAQPSTTAGAAIRQTRAGDPPSIPANLSNPGPRTAPPPASTMGLQNALADLASPTPGQAAPSPQVNALAPVAGGLAPSAPNALAGIGQPQPGSQGAPATAQLAAFQQQPPAASQPGGVPPGFLPLRSPKTGAFAPAAQPGYILYQNDATKQVIAGREPGTTPTLHFENVGGQLVGSDPNTGAIVSRQDLGNTGRLSDAPDGNGGIIKYDPRGNVVVHTPSNTNQLLQMEDYKRDQTVAQTAAEELSQAKQTEFAIREQRAITSGLQQTGAFGDRKAALANYLESTFSPETAKAFENAAGLDDASMSQEFAKTALAAAGQQENANVGARGGFGLTQMYTKANPGLGSQPTVIRDIQNLQSVSNLAQQDYLQGLLGHINQNSNSMRAGGAYSPSTNFSQQFNSGNNPQVYLGAAEMLNQKPYAKWSAGLSPDDQQKAKAIAARVNNTASYIGPNGPAALTPYGAPQQSGQSGGAGSVPPSAAAALRQNPGLAAQFDAKYGQGASRGVLGQ